MAETPETDLHQDELISARENITTLIYRRLKMRLMTGGYMPGDALVLRSLAEELNVSQTPIREAMLQLVTERALTMSRGKSVTVPVFDRVRLQHLRAIRLKLELMAAQYAIESITAQDIDRLEQIHEAMSKSKQAQEREGTMRLNFEFHSTLYAASNMPDLIAIIEGLWAQTGPSLMYLYQPPFVHNEGRHPHLDVIASLREHRTDDLLKAVARDVEEYGAALAQRLPPEMT